MVTKNLGLLLALLVVTGCSISYGRVCSPNSAFLFQVDSVKFYQDHDSLPAGDTIHMKTAFSKTLINTNSGSTVNFNGADNLGIVLKNSRFTGGSLNDSGLVNANLNVEYRVVQGSGHSTSSPFFYQECYFAELDSDYELQVDIITKDTGTFFIGISDAAGVTRSNDCTRADFVFGITDSQQHLEYYRFFFPEYDLSLYQQTHSYCYHVY